MLYFVSEYFFGMGIAKKGFSILVALMMIGLFPTAVVAQVVEPPIAKVLITELQTESQASANEEFIEITNVSEATIDLAGWVIQYRSATGTSWQDKALLSGMLYVSGSLVVSTQSYNVEGSTFFWTATGGQLAATGGNIRVLAPGLELAEDTLAWGNGIFGETTAATKALKGKSIHRKTVDAKYVDTNNNSADFVEDLADPVNVNATPEPVEVTDPVDDPIPVPDENTEQPPVDVIPDIVPDDIESPEVDQPPLPQEDSPAPDTPSNPPLSIMITELMINPASPELDSKDEWVELYNPNDQVFNLTGFKLQAGSSYGYTYLFADTLIQPFGYLSISSGESNLALSNTTGAVRLLDETGEIHGSTVSYDEVEEGSTYALDGLDQWLWTTTPTKSSFNVFTEAPVIIKTAIKKTTAAKQPAQATKKASTVKTTAVKASTASSAKKVATKATKAKTESFNEAPVEQKTRPLLLATFAVIAVLYGLYEYRDDLSNSMWRAKRYAKAWRKNR